MPPRLRVVDGKQKTKDPSKPSEPAAVWMSPKLLKPWADNPRINDHVVPHLIESIEEFGWGKPILVRQANFEIIAGHTAWKAAMQMNKPYVPVRLLDISEEQAHKLALADNRIGELADWDMGPLTKMLKEMTAPDISKLGWDDEQYKKLQKISEEEVVVPEAVVEDSLPRLPKQAITRPGDLWALGKHRLFCGDSTIKEHVAKACGDLHPFICVTAPPADTAVDTILASALRSFKGDVAYVWCLTHVGSIERQLEDETFECRAQIVWRKPSFVLGRGHYQHQHESCWYAVRSGMSAKWCGGRKESTVWDIAGMAAFGQSTDSTDTSTGHDTQKPVECFARPLRNHGKAGDVVYEPFAGSGTALVAAEQLERICVAVELNPLFCDLIVDRWQRLTGGKAKRRVG